MHKPTLILFILWLAQTCLSYSFKIPELLGHSSRKTTEIYTQVSTKNLQQIRSPFDDLGKLYTLDRGKKNYAYASKSANWGSFIAAINELCGILKRHHEYE